MRMIERVAKVVCWELNQYEDSRGCACKSARDCDECLVDYDPVIEAIARAAICAMRVPIRQWFAENNYTGDLTLATWSMFDEWLDSELEERDDG